MEVWLDAARIPEEPRGTLFRPACFSALLGCCLTQLSLAVLFAAFGSDAMHVRAWPPDACPCLAPRCMSLLGSLPTIKASGDTSSGGLLKSGPWRR